MRNGVSEGEPTTEIKTVKTYQALPRHLPKLKHLFIRVVASETLTYHDAITIQASNPQPIDTRSGQGYQLARSVCTNKSGRIQLFPNHYQQGLNVKL